MKRVLKNSKREREFDEADRIETAIVALGVSDFKPILKTYTMAPAEHKMWMLLQIHRALLKVNRNPPDLINENPIGTMMPPLGSASGIVASEVWLHKSSTMTVCPHGARVVKLRWTRIQPSGKANSFVNLLSDRPTPGFRWNKASGQYKQWFPIGGAACGYHDYCRHPDVIEFAEWVTDFTWSISYSLDGAPAVRIPSSFDGVSGMFIMRELNPGLTRRQALKHWVKEHNRTISGERTVQVSGHFRGVDWFDWFGLKCRIHPPHFLRKEEAAHA